MDPFDPITGPSSGDDPGFEVLHALFFDAAGNPVEPDDPAAVEGEVEYLDADGNVQRTYFGR